MIGNDAKKRSTVKKAIKTNKNNENFVEKNERVQHASTSSHEPEELIRKSLCKDIVNDNRQTLDNGINEKIEKEFLKYRNSEAKEVDYNNINDNGKSSRKKYNDDKEDEEDEEPSTKNFVVNISIDLVTLLLFGVAFCTRVYKLATPNNIVFDELHYGKYVNMYMKNVFFFDQHPPLGKQLLAGVAYLTGYDGNFTFSKIGAEYSSNVPIFWLRFLPVVCGSLLSPAVYKLLLEAGLNRWTALLGGILVILDNSLLTQSRFILMESMLLLFCTLGILFLLRFQKSKFISTEWIAYGTLSASFLTFTLCVKFVGFYSCCLAFFIIFRYLWNLLLDKKISDLQIIFQSVARWLMFVVIPVAIYITVFYIHLKILHKAGPHDSAMTSAFQASLDGGLATITKGQPIKVAHGSQVTLRHTHGRTCWLHSHAHVYPIRYPDKRGSSHQQQVTCYSFKDVNNWWIIKRPEKSNLFVGEDPDIIRHGDIIQLVHGITSRALNTHDVAAPMTPTCQEVTCYIDYNISMPAQLLWQVDIVNKDTEGPIWNGIKSHVRFIHVDTRTALRFTGRQLPNWGFHQHEVVADRVIEQQDTIWNVEEHRYTKSDDKKERERQLFTAEMLPTERTYLTFWDKFIELNTKMLWHPEIVQSHMYSSDPIEWPLMDKGIAYWVDNDSNGQIYLLGNLVIWYSGSIAIFIYIGLLAVYLMRRRRLYFDLSKKEWDKFIAAGDLFLGGYFIHYLPYFFVDRTLFLHNYFPAFLFKLFLLCFILEHIDYIIRKFLRNSIGVMVYRAAICSWLAAVFIVFKKFLALSYGIEKLSAAEITALRYKDSWDFILHKDIY